MRNIHPILKTAGKVAGISLAVAAVFGLYLVFIGIPKTQARNYYNKGVLSIQSGQVREGLQDFQTAVSYWPEPYIVAQLNGLQQLSD